MKKRMKKRYMYGGAVAALVVAFGLGQSTTETTAPAPVAQAASTVTTTVAPTTTTTERVMTTTTAPTTTTTEYVLTVEDKEMLFALQMDLDLDLGWTDDQYVEMGYGVCEVYAEAIDLGRDPIDVAFDLLYVFDFDPVIAGSFSGAAPVALCPKYQWFSDLVASAAIAYGSDQH